MLLGDGLKKANGKLQTTFAVSELQFVPKRIRSTASMRDDEGKRDDANEEVNEHEEFYLTLRDSNIRTELLERLNTFRRNRELCDVVLFVAETEIFAHKVVLAATSPALFDMFLSDGSDSQHRSVTPPSSAAPTVQREFSTQPSQPLSYFEFADTDFDCFSALVNYAYTAHLEISSRKVAELHKTACALRMTTVVEVCSRYLADNLSVENCIGIRKQANFTNDAFLVEKVDAFIAGNFDRISSESSEFTQLPCIKSRIIVSSEETPKGLNLAEKAVEYFQALGRKRDRVEQVIEFLSAKTHLLYLDSNHKLADCSSMDDHSHVGSCDVIQDYKRHANATHVMGAEEQKQKHVIGATAIRLEADRLNNGTKFPSNESLASTGSTETESEDEGDNRVITVSKTSGDFWVGLAVLHHRLITLSTQITDDEDLVRSHRSKDTKVPVDVSVKPPNSATLTRLVSYTGAPRTPLAHMNAGRCSIGAAFLNGKIIVCGGYDRGACMKTVEEYDIATGTWRALPDMLNGRGRFDSAVLGGKLYAVAGSNGQDDLKSVEVFDPKLEKWTALKSLNTPRSHNGCASVDNFIYCVGGISDQNVLKDCERYDPEKNVWEKIAPLEVARYQSGCTAWKGLVIACGGNDRWNTIDSVEAYDPKTNSWKQLAKLRTPRRGCAVAVVRDALYVIGGNDGSQPLSSVEVLDHPNGQWRAGPALTTPRANTHGVVTAGQVIYVIGGFDGRFLDTIELLENEAVGWRSWEQLGSNLDEVDAEEEEDVPKSSEVPTVNQRAVSAS